MPILFNLEIENDAKIMPGWGTFSAGDLMLCSTCAAICMKGQEWLMRKDLSGIKQILLPLEESGILVKRTDEEVSPLICTSFSVVEREGHIIARAALLPFYEEKCGEVAAFAVSPDCRGQGQGDKLLHYIEKKAASIGLEMLFLLTTRTAHCWNCGIVGSAQAMEFGWSCADLDHRIWLAAVSRQNMLDHQARAGSISTSAFYPTPTSSRLLTTTSIAHQPYYPTTDGGTTDTPFSPTLEPLNLDFLSGGETSGQTYHLMWILNELGSPYGDVDQKLASYFMQALFGRMTGSSERTHRALVSTSDETCSFESIRKTMLMFQEVSPWTTFGHVACNGVLMEALEGEQKLHTIDISSTFCTQWPTLLEVLATRTDYTPTIALIKQALALFLHLNLYMVSDMSLVSFLHSDCLPPCSFDAVKLRTQPIARAHPISLSGWHTFEKLYCQAIGI
ncbi:hypothetical protein SAY87_008422 [Trapa incisa]|uniref:N-acetyltransferase domain-containing protein n=1 Tax=Trapa incisa TaxID=236973 RepID=A0AAN7KNS8_9MYRT|nr:hypothetical protein SAY87_008422 [Trapa incisa]